MPDGSYEPDSIELLWRAGDLEFLLRESCQAPIYRETLSSKALLYVWEISRRYGKSFMLLTIALHVALTTPNATIHYAAPTGKMVRNILIPNLRVLLRTCPRDLVDMSRDWKRAEGKLVIPGTGSEIHMAGCEDEQKADALRGTKSNLFIIDEAGFVNVLAYVVKDIAMPQTMPNPDTLPRGGRILVASTPAISPGHDFAGLCIRAEAGGSYQHRTIYDSSAVNPQLIQQYMAEAGGERSTSWQREYLALRVVDEARAIIPEFTPRESEIVREVPRPDYITPYTSMDAGFERDLTACLFSYWDFKNARLVIEDELTFEPQSATTVDIAAGIKAKESQLWDSYFAYLRERRMDHGVGVQRWLDAQGPVRLDLAKLHGLTFSQTRRDEREAAINEARIWIAQGKVVIHPRCKDLIAHLKAGIWNEKRTDFERVLGFGHFDYVAALVYQIRNVDRQHNPYPVHGPDVSHDTHWVREPEHDPHAAWRELFTPKV